MSNSLKVNLVDGQGGVDRIFIYRFGQNPSTEIVDVKNPSCGTDKPTIPNIYGTEREVGAKPCDPQYVDPLTGKMLQPDLNTQFTDPLTGSQLNNLTVNITDAPLPEKLRNLPVKTETDPSLIGGLFPGFGNNADALTTTNTLLNLAEGLPNIIDAPSAGTRFAFGIDLVTNLVGGQTGKIPEYYFPSTNGLDAAFYMIGKTNQVWMHVNQAYTNALQNVR